MCVRGEQPEWFYRAMILIVQGAVRTIRRPNRKTIQILNFDRIQLVHLTFIANPIAIATTEDEDRKPFARPLDSVSRAIIRVAWTDNATYPIAERSLELAIPYWLPST